MGFLQKLKFWRSWKGKEIKNKELGKLLSRLKDLNQNMHQKKVSFQKSRTGSSDQSKQIQGLKQQVAALKKKLHETEGHERELIESNIRLKDHICWLNEELKHNQMNLTEQQPYKKPAGRCVDEHHQKSKSVLKPRHMDLGEGVERSSALEELRNTKTIHRVRGSDQGPQLHRNDSNQPATPLDL